MFIRRLFSKTQSLKELLLGEAKNLRDEAHQLPFGPARDAALKKARKAEAAAHVEDWLNSPGLRPPKSETPGPIDTH